MSYWIGKPIQNFKLKIFWLFNTVVVILRVISTVRMFYFNENSISGFDYSILVYVGSIFICNYYYILRSCSCSKTAQAMVFFFFFMLLFLLLLLSKRHHPYYLTLFQKYFFPTSGEDRRSSSQYGGSGIIFFKHMLDMKLCFFWYFLHKYTIF